MPVRLFGPARLCIVCTACSVATRPPILSAGDPVEPPERPEPPEAEPPEPEQLELRWTAEGAAARAGVHEAQYPFDVAWRLDSPRESAWLALPRTVEGPLQALPESGDPNAPIWMVRGEGLTETHGGVALTCLGTCDAARAALHAVPASLALEGSVLVAFEPNPDLDPTQFVGEGFVVGRGDGHTLRWQDLVAAVVPGPSHWRAGVARYAEWTATSEGDGARLLRLVAEAYTRHRTAPHPIAAGQDLDGAGLLAFCADLHSGGSIWNPPVEVRETQPPMDARRWERWVEEAAAFRGVVEFDGCLRAAGLKLVALRVPRYDARSIRRLLGGATAEGSPPVVVRSPGPLRPGDRLLYLRGVRLESLDDIGLALVGIERGRRLVLTVQRDERRVRQWITVPTLEAESEAVRFAIEAPEDWSGPHRSP